MEWNIAEVKIKNQIVVGPMAGISNSAFRELAHEFGAGLIYTEMISDKALYFGNKKTVAMTNITTAEGLVSMQLFGYEIDSLVFAAEFLDKNSTCSIIDINMGCPVPKVVNSGAGSALMKTLDLAYEIVRNIKKAVKKPVTVKMRSGWDQASCNGLEFAQLMEKAGADALAVHGRLRSQYYSGKADWQIIKEIKNSVKIPVIGNGDLSTVSGIREKLKVSGCDAVMISRGILGNPWLIREAVQFLENGALPSPTNKDRFRVAREHALKLIDLKGEKLAMKEMRGHACWYIQGLPFNHRVKDSLNQMTSYEQFDTILSDYQEQLSKTGV